MQKGARGIRLHSHVPMHQATIGLVSVPSLIASQIRYSSVPPTSPSNTIILTCGLLWYRSRWSQNVLPGYRSPPIAMPSYTPLVCYKTMGGAGL